jgi:hypothetical protein
MVAVAEAQAARDLGGQLDGHLPTEVTRAGATSGPASTRKPPGVLPQTVIADEVRAGGSKVLRP